MSGLLKVPLSANWWVGIGAQSICLQIRLFQDAQASLEPLGHLSPDFIGLSCPCPRRLLHQEDVKS